MFLCLSCDALTVTHVQAVALLAANAMAWDVLPSRLMDARCRDSNDYSQHEAMCMSERMHERMNPE